MSRNEPLFQITTFQIGKKPRQARACERCRKSHKKCRYDSPQDDVCILCKKAKVTCVVKGTIAEDTVRSPTDTPGPISVSSQSLVKTGSSSSNLSQDHALVSLSYTNNSNKHKKRKLSIDDQLQDSNDQKKSPDSEEQHLFHNDKIYANVIEQEGGVKSQFVVATQPLAPLLSRDSFLCLSDAGNYDLFFPWRDVYLPRRDQYLEEMDKDLYEFLAKKGAFDKPPVDQQVHLIQLYLDNLYPIMPVVDRDILNDLELMSPLLLNALMLSGVRYDKSLQDKEIRLVAEKFRQKCKLLEIGETNKIALIQAYLLLSVHEETPQGPQVAREYLCKASTLIVELGLHNFGANNNHTRPTPGLAKSLSTDFKLSYKRSLLSRLFWVSYCCDRMTTVTSAAAMYYHKIDLIVDQPNIEDFEGVPRDYEIFKRYYFICELLERIINVVYRIPGYRIIDPSLEKDLLYWESVNFPPELISLIGDQYHRFFKILSSFCILLYLRSKVDFMSMLEDEEDKKELLYTDSPLTDNKIRFLTEASKIIVENLGDQHVEHVVVIQAVLHVVVLLHLEIKTREDVAVNDTFEDPSDLLGFKKDLYDKCLKFLEDNSNKWFLSAASYYLCKELLHRRSTFDDSRSLSSGQSPLDLLAFMNEQHFVDMDNLNI